MATIRDVARKAQVSQVTVSRVLNQSGPVSDETEKRVLAAIEELCYVPNVLARGLRSRRTQTIALVITDVTNPFWTTVARGVEDKAAENGFSVILCNTDEDPEKEDEYLDILLQKRVDGIIIAPTGRASGGLPNLPNDEILYVLIDRCLPGCDADVVRGDSLEGACQLVQHLLEIGHRRIGLITGPAHVSTADDRLAGYRQALEEFQIPFDPDLVLRGNYDEESGYELTNALLSLSDQPTAIFAANNFIAIGALRALRDARVRVPEEMAIVTFDEIPQLSVVYPFLTVIAQPAYEMGAIATQLLLERLAGLRDERREIVLKTKLIIRASSGNSNLAHLPAKASLV